MSSERIPKGVGSCLRRKQDRIKALELALNSSDKALAKERTRRAELEDWINDAPHKGGCGLGTSTGDCDCGLWDLIGGPREGER